MPGIQSILNAVTNLISIFSLPGILPDNSTNRLFCFSPEYLNCISNLKIICILFFTFIQIFPAITAAAVPNEETVEEIIGLIEQGDYKQLKTRTRNMDKESINVETPSGDSFLHVAISQYVKPDIITSTTDARTKEGIHNNNSKSIITYLLSRGADPNFRDSNGITPLLTVIVKSGFKADIYLPITRMLIKHGGDINLTDYQGNSILHIAVSSYVQSKRTEKTLEKLKNKGKDISLYKERAMLNSEMPDPMNFFANMAKLGININARNEKGDTPLLMALVNNSEIGLLKSLLSNDADPEISNDREMSALHLLTLPKYNVPSENQEYLESVRKIQLFLDAGVAINSVDKRNLSPLSYSVQFALDMEQALLKGRQQLERYKKIKDPDGKYTKKINVLNDKFDLQQKQINYAWEMVRFLIANNAETDTRLQRSEKKTVVDIISERPELNLDKYKKKNFAQKFKKRLFIELWQILRYRQI